MPYAAYLVRLPRQRGGTKMQSIVVEILLIVLMVLANGLFAMSEMAVVSARKARLQQRAEHGDAGARAALELIESPNRFLSTVQIGITLVGILAGAFGGATIAQEVADWLSGVPLIGPYGEILGVAAVVLGITYLSLVLGELAPKRLALNDAEGIASRVARPMQTLALLMTPVVRILTGSTDVALRLIGSKTLADTPVTEEEIEILIEQGIQAGVFEQYEHDIVERVLDLDTRRAKTVMTPRTKIVWLDIEAQPEESWQKMVDSGHSYFPVCQGSVDKVLGIISVKTVWASMLTSKDIDIRASLQPAAYVPETVPLLRLLKQIKETGQHLVIVLGEHGDVEGLITLRDVTEAIVGHLPSLGDKDEEVQVTQREDGTWLIDGRFSLDEFKRLFDIEEKLPNEDRDGYQTLGGFIMSQLGRIPAVTDHFTWQKLRFEVVDMDEHRVDKVLVSHVIE
jgi:putative hemolysin